MSYPPGSGVTCYARTARVEQNGVYRGLTIDPNNDTRVFGARVRDFTVEVNKIAPAPCSGDSPPVVPASGFNWQQNVGMAFDNSGVPPAFGNLFVPSTTQIRKLPSSGGNVLVATGFTRATGVAFTSDYSALIVVDNNGNLWRVDPATGTKSLITSGLTDARAVAVRRVQGRDQIYVALPTKIIHVPEALVIYRISGDTVGAGLGTTELVVPDTEDTLGRARRAFVGRTSAGDLSVHDSITLQAQTWPPAAGVTIYWLASDPDDPSSNTAPIDGNDGAGPTGMDNRGIAGGGLRGQAPGDPPFGEPGVLAGAAANGVATSTTDATGVATITLQISQQPGDNFIVRAARTEAAVLAGTAGEVAESGLITTWRTLWIQFDTMGEPDLSDSASGERFGTLTGIAESCCGAGQDTLSDTTGHPTFPIAPFGRTDSLRDALVDPNTGVAGPAVLFKIDNNGQQQVVAYPYMDAGGVPHTMTTEGGAPGAAYSIDTDDVAPAPRVSFTNTQAALLNYINGDRANCAGAGRLQCAYIEARLLTDGDLTEDVPFVRNQPYDNLMGTGPLNGGPVAATADDTIDGLTPENDYWRVLVATHYEANDDFDVDPSDGAAGWGIQKGVSGVAAFDDTNDNCVCDPANTGTTVPDPGEPSIAVVIFEETMREVALINGAALDLQERRVAAHEVCHLFGLQHETGTLMDGGILSADQLSDRALHELRTRLRPAANPMDPDPANP